MATDHMGGKFGKSGHVDFFDTRGQTHADRNTSPPYWERQVSTVANGPAQRNRTVDRLVVDCRSSKVLST